MGDDRTTELFPRVWVTDTDIEVGVNIEPRRAGDVMVSILNGDHEYGWIRAADARRLAQVLLVAARESEDMVMKKADRGRDAPSSRTSTPSQYLER